MNRKNFLKRLSLGMIALSVIPNILNNSQKKRFIIHKEPFPIGESELISDPNIKWIKTQEGQDLWYLESELDKHKEFQKQKDLNYFQKFCM